MLSHARKLSQIIREDGILEGVNAVRRFLRWQLLYNSNNPLWAAKYGGFVPTLGILTEKVSGKNIHKWYLKKRYGNPVITEVNDYQVYVDLNDPGLSTDLLAYGVREPRSTSVLRAELERLRANQDEVKVLELGANIGYYALFEASVLGEASDIHAFEPGPDNVSLLEKNVELNGYESQFNINHMAVGDKRDTIELELTNESNLNVVRSESKDLSWIEESETYSVDQTSVDEYLDERDINPEDIDLIRMDVEGHEYEIFDGMGSILDSDTSFVLFFETHFGLMTDDKKHEIIDLLIDNNFSIVEVSRGFRDPQIHTFEDLRESGGEVILRR